MARYDSASQVEGPPVEVPAPDALVVPTGEEIVAISRDPGPLRIWLAAHP
jgi:hypothetical protein